MFYSHGIARDAERLAEMSTIAFWNGILPAISDPGLPLDQRRYLSLPLRDICLSSHAFWFMQCIGDVPKVYGCNLSRYD
ncbi:hypothetical protein Tco_1218489 [Tanacetum coccineum]